MSGCNGAAHKTTSSAAPGPPSTETIPEVHPPEAPPEATANTPEQAPLSTWDEVVSGHPEGATNPPMPALVVTEDGRCFKQWQSPMAIRHMPVGDRVDTCDEPEACGTPIVCPDERAKALLDAHAKAAGD